MPATRIDWRASEEGVVTDRALSARSPRRMLPTEPHRTGRRHGGRPHVPLGTSRPPAAVHSALGFPSVPAAVRPVGMTSPPGRSVPITANCALIGRGR